ncbi:signal peptide peptidase-domain-containing protein [Hypoxylon trugodes]|uniref:signal peptide peptidase-domain-containing protein n=1 Tax=Hypoxylon trugodes TaxID=326681 RepID=UPI0021916353|nr:signal peptide peptidase-domain-containing protein [Hypoxylon trugodes]KAI1392032.1 signal peptide peptidase-domain-containing protein [Hypoxylon trugodes]
MASNNSTLLAASEISATNMIEFSEADLTFSEKLATLPTVLWENSDMFVLEGRIIFAAMTCIYIASYASLRRPPSAQSPKKGKKGARKEDQDEEDQIIHGLEPSDAILMPLMAGVVLVGLYYLIKWLEDPDILNKILRFYFSALSLASSGKLFADTLHSLTSFVFPTVWVAKDGKIWHIDSAKRSHWSKTSDSLEQVWDDKKRTPFPGRWSESSISDAKNSLLWEVRHLLREQWTVRTAIHGIMHETVKVKFNDILGIVLAVVANVIYYTTNSTLLSNIMGYSFSYTGIILMSPTTFTTGTGLLFGLFLYDIYMVFYTPYMVTVATKLDVPIKLVFEGPKKGSMLGLGDIVLPGIFIALCLRFDHYLYYHKQRKLVPVELKSEDESSGQLVTNTETQRMVVKPDYVNPQGQWGDRFWSTSLRKTFSPDATPALKASAFPKTYFYAAMVGYFFAMIATLAMLFVFRHAQPALLYLVPGVVCAVWFTGLVRGELREMWTYTEDGKLDTTDTIVQVDGNGNVIDVISDKKDGKSDDKSKEEQKTLTDGKSSNKDTSSAGQADEKKPDGNHTEPERKLEFKKKDGGYPVFLFSIEAPPPKRSADS